MTPLERPVTISPAKKIVVLKVIKLTDITHGIIETVSKDTPELGEVIAIGKGVLPVLMKVGDTVAYRRYGESKFQIKSEEILFISFDDILAVLKEKK